MRDFNRNNGRGGSREMFDAVCDKCGDHCKVPFKPTGNKPIFCSNCFEKQGGSDSRNSRNNRRDRSRDKSRNRSFSKGSRDREMHSAICDECGMECEIPFKPSTDKPIYCSDCFAKKNEGNSRGGSRSNDFEKQFQAINEKLDEILQILSLVKDTELKKTITKSKKKVVAKKKAVKKNIITKKTSAKKSSKKKSVEKTSKKPAKKITKKIPNLLARSRSSAVAKAGKKVVKKK